jgi:V8-like Glu-specific endopeptidase
MVFRFIKAFIVGAALAIIVSHFNFSNKTKVNNPIFLFGDMQSTDQSKFSPLVRLVNDKGRGFCSAFIIDKHYAITAAHCVSDKEIDNEVFSLFSDSGKDTYTTVKTLSFDSSTDLAVLVGDFDKFSPLQVNFNNEGFPTNEVHTYYTCGFPLAQKHATCHEFTPIEMNYFKVAGKGHLIPGMSGGPVINELSVAVGINSSVLEDMVFISPLEGMLGLFNLE